jgi:hypothetical protein
MGDEPWNIEYQQPNNEDTGFWLLVTWSCMQNNSIETSRIFVGVRY